jgi:hypothetical protein
MTTPALHRCANKDSLYVAGITIDQRMVRVEREVSFVVTKGQTRVSRNGIIHNCHQQERKQARQCNREPKPPSKVEYAEI